MRISLFLILISAILNGCNTNSEGDYTCFYKKTDKKIELTYPFNRATRIKIFSYDQRDPKPTDTLIKNGVFQIQSLEEFVLNTQQTDSLFSILYNYKIKLKATGEVNSEADCYWPRHSIVFYSKDKAFAFLELCIECNRHQNSSGLDFGEFCTEKMCKLQAYFKSIGLKEGFDNEECRND